jgi:hypothetical protein
MKLAHEGKKKQTNKIPAVWAVGIRSRTLVASDQVAHHSSVQDRNNTASYHIWYPREWNLKQLKTLHLRPQNARSVLAITMKLVIVYPINETFAKFQRFITFPNAQSAESKKARSWSCMQRKTNFSCSSAQIFHFLMTSPVVTYFRDQWRFLWQKATVLFLYR